MVAGTLSILMIVLTIGGLWLGEAAPQVIETSGRSIPVEVWVVLCTILLLVSAYALATLVPGASRIEIRRTEIVVRMPLPCGGFLSPRCGTIRSEPTLG